MTAKIRSAAVEAFEKSLVKSGEAVSKKWEHFLDAEGAPAITDASDRWAMAQMLENEENSLKTAAMEASQTTSVFGANYQKALLGMTRQVFPRLFGTQLVATQPMDRPSGQIFHLAITRDDGSSNGYVLTDDNTNANQAALLASRTYADLGTQDSGIAPAEGLTITKGMALSITSSNVTIGKAKKLKTEATMELQQDLQAVHNLNALDLLQGAAVDEIAAEIDGMMVKAVYDAAVAHTTVTFGTTAPTGEGWTKKEWLRELPKALVKVDRRISKATLRRPNVIVVGFDAYEALLNLQSFVMNPNADWDSGSMALQQVGSFQNQYNVFVSRYVPDNEIILGRKGSGFLDSGVVYAPYVPLFVSERFFDVTKQTTAQSYASRFGLFTITNLLYGRVVIDSSTGIS